MRLPSRFQPRNKPAGCFRGGGLSRESFPKGINRLAVPFFVSSRRLSQWAVLHHHSERWKRDISPTPCEAGGHASLRRIRGKPLRARCHGTRKHRPRRQSARLASPYQGLRLASFSEHFPPRYKITQNFLQQKTHGLIASKTASSHNKRPKAGLHFCRFRQKRR